ncbi:MAG TPA: extracellular solute-binding protein [Polyangiaceae bacterium]|nr:extracellular solute-binding protein [Polyangiaceae bacterium]
MVRVSLRSSLLAFIAFLVAVSWWTWTATRDVEEDGRERIVFWSGWSMRDDVIYDVIRRFEQLHPHYRVTTGTGTARDLVGDAQRLMSAIAGGVPPDLVFFDRLGIGEWASKNALEDLTPYIEGQDPADPYRIDLTDYFSWSVEEATYRAPGAPGKPRLYGVPTTADIRLLFSNLDLLRQEGIVDERGEPRPPTTWEELRAAASKLSRYRIPRDKTSGLVRLGFAPGASSTNYGETYLYLYAFQAGGEMMSPDRLRVTMDSPPVVRALRFMTDVYDDLGGVTYSNGFQEAHVGFRDTALDAFLQGQVAMKIDGDYALEVVGEFKPDLNFAVTPAPMPEDELAKGQKPVTWAGGWSLVIPSTAKHKKGAFELIRYLRSWECADRVDRSMRQRKDAEGRLHLPRLDPHRIYNERFIQRAIFDEPTIPLRIKQAYPVILSMLEHTRIRPVSPVGQMLWGQHLRAYEAGVNHRYAEEARATGEDEIRLALSKMQEPVQRQLEEVMRPAPPHAVAWTPYVFVYAALGAVLLAVILFRSRRGRSLGFSMRETSAALLFASPWFVGFALLIGGPILFSIVVSFTRYDVLTEARYVGLSNYREVLSDPVFFKSLSNTAFMLLRIPLVMAAGLGIALLLRSGLRGMGVYRSMLYLPAVMPVVATSLVWTWLFNAPESFVNRGIRWCFDTVPAHALERVISLFTAAPFHLDAPLWLQDPALSKPALILMNVWTAGGSMVIWLTGLQAIPKQLQEAASIDGAGAWRRFISITIPMLSPYILFNLIIGVIATMQIFTEAYIMTVGGPVDSTLFYAYYLFKQAFQYFRMGYASALGWILFVAVLALTLLQLWVSKRWVHYDQT